MKISSKFTKNNLVSTLVLAAWLAVPVVAIAAPSNYFVVVPVDNHGTLAEPKITITLLAAALLVSTVNEPYIHDLNVYLQIAGNSSYDPSLLSWSAVNLPERFQL